MSKTKTAARGLLAGAAMLLGIAAAGAVASPASASAWDASLMGSGPMGANSIIIYGQATCPGTGMFRVAGFVSGARPDGYIGTQVLYCTQPGQREELAYVVYRHGQRDLRLGKTYGYVLTLQGAAGGADEAMDHGQFVL